MSDDLVKYNQALARQNLMNGACTVVKRLWTPEFIELTRRDGLVVECNHDYKWWPVTEVKK